MTSTRTDDQEIQEWTSSEEYRLRARQWLENFKAGAEPVPFDEAARDFAAAVDIDVPLARGILKRLADPEGYVDFRDRKVN